MANLAAVIELNHPPEAGARAKLIHQFGLSGAGFVYNNNPDNLDEELTQAELDTIEEHRRADGALGHSLSTLDDVADSHVGRVSFIEGGVNRHVHDYSVKETGREQGAETVGDTGGDENTVTDTGRLKLGIQDVASARAEQAKARKAYVRILQEESARQQLEALNRRIAELTRKRDQLLKNVERLEEQARKIDRAKAILADGVVTDDEQAELTSIQSSLAAEGFDLGIETNADGSVDVGASSANVNRAETEVDTQLEKTEVELDETQRELDDATEERDEILRTNPELRSEVMAARENADVIDSTTQAVVTSETVVAEERSLTESYNLEAGATFEDLMAAQAEQQSVDVASADVDEPDTSDMSDDDLFAMFDFEGEELEDFDAPGTSDPGAEVMFASAEPLDSAADGFNAYAVGGSFAGSAESSNETAISAQFNMAAPDQLDTVTVLASATPDNSADQITPPVDEYQGQQVQAKAMGFA